MQVSSKIKMPTTKERRKSPNNRYPWNEMNVGDSFRIYERDDPYKLVIANNNARNMNKRQPYKMFVADRYKGTIRIWRTK